MKGIEVLKAALEAGVKVLPKDFLEDNGIKAKFLGGVDRECYNAYLIEEEGEFKDKVVYVSI